MKNYQLSYKVMRALFEGSFEGKLAYTSMNNLEAQADLLTVLKIFPHAKVFELDKDITSMLYHTKNKVRLTRLPFPVTWVETELKLYDTWIKTEKGLKKTAWTKYHGFLLVEAGELKQEDTLVVKEKGRLVEAGYPNIFIYSVIEDKSGLGHLKISLYKEYQDLKLKRYGREWRIWRRERDRLREFIMSFLDFLHNPEVQIVEVLRSDKARRKRIRKGKLPLPSSNIIRVTGVLKKYIRELKKGKAFTYSHRFWVRGHWRHLTSSYYKAMRGKRIWIPPYIKGSGILIDKSYKLVDRRKYTEKYYKGILRAREVEP